MITNRSIYSLLFASALFGFAFPAVAQDPQPNGEPVRVAKPYVEALADTIEDMTKKMATSGCMDARGLTPPYTLAVFGFANADYYLERAKHVELREQTNAGIRKASGYFQSLSAEGAGWLAQYAPLAPEKRREKDLYQAKVAQGGTKVEEFLRKLDTAPMWLNIELNRPEPSVVSLRFALFGRGTSGSHECTDSTLMKVNLNDMSVVEKTKTFERDFYVLKGAFRHGFSQAQANTIKAETMSIAADVSLPGTCNVKTGTRDFASTVYNALREEQLINRDRWPQQIEKSQADSQGGQKHLNVSLKLKTTKIASNVLELYLEAREDGTIATNKIYNIVIPNHKLEGCETPKPPKFITKTVCDPKTSDCKPVGHVFRDCAQCPEMIVVPSGKIKIGSNDRKLEPGGKWNAIPRPITEIQFARPFAVSLAEVTVQEFSDFLQVAKKRRQLTSTKRAKRRLSVDRLNLHSCGEMWFRTRLSRLKSPLKMLGYRPRSGKANLPMNFVSWFGAKEYVAWLSEATTKPYRLLSEAEWEYVARAGKDGKRYGWGDDAPQRKANCKGCLPGEKTKPRDVRKFEKNAFGVYDMHGNVAEWVDDCWHDTYEGISQEGLARTVGASCKRHIIRGGSFDDNPNAIQSAARNSAVKGTCSINIGFRVARSLRQEELPRIIQARTDEN